MPSKIFQHGFGGGEIAPSLLGRTELPHYKMGAYRIDNMVILPQGAIRSRAGFKYIGTPIAPSKEVRLIPFRYSSTQSFILEFGDYTMRIISNGGYILNGNGNVLTITTPYASTNLHYLDYSQNADIITLTSNLYAPYELRRYSNTDWRFVAINLSPTISPPSSISVSPIYANQMTDAENASKNKINVTYVVTAFDSNEVESVASRQVSGTGNYYINGAKIRVSWNAVSGAIRYRLYRNVSGIFGYVGETTGLSIDDTGMNPDTGTTPPLYKTIFTGSSQTITSITIASAGQNYRYGLIDNVTYLPRSLYIDAIQPFTSTAGVSAESVSAWALTDAHIEILNGSTGTVIKSFNLPIEYETIEHDGSFYRCAYLASTTTMTITSSKLAVTQCIIKFVFGCTGDYEANYFSESTHQPHDKSSSSAFNTLHHGISVGDYIVAFTQNTTVQIPLTIEDQIGVNADIDCVFVNGAASQIVINAAGSGYSSATSAVCSSTVGSGASFTVNTTGGSLPDYPSTSTQYDQRRVFAGSSPHPLKVWFTNAGQQNLMAYHLPVLDDDRIEIEAVTSDADRIKHIVALDSLVMFTSTSELRVYTQNSDALTPRSIAVKAQSYIGANEVQPVVANSTIVYAASRGGHIRALGYDYTQNGYVTQDISLRCPHLFDNKEIISITLSKAPVQIVWCVSSDGALLSCTYLPEQQLIAWSQHHTLNGLFEDVCAISEGQEDHLYAVINRNGTRRVERLDNLRVPSDAISYRYLDSFLDAVFPTATRSVNGLTHLEGQEVAVFVDGVQQTNKVVNDGTITLDSAGHYIAVGLPITDTLITLPLTQNSENNSEMAGKTKNVTETYFRVSYSGNIKANVWPHNNLYSCKKTDVYVQPQDSDSYMVKVSLDGDWSLNGQIRAVHDDALPLEIQAVVNNISYEGGN